MSKKRKVSTNYILKKKCLMGSEEETVLQIIPIVLDDYLSQFDTEKMFVGKILCKKQTARLIKELSAIWPLGTHLKRVRWTLQKDVFEILLRPVLADETVNNPSLQRVLGSSGINSDGLAESVVIVEVPKNPASTSDQYRTALKYWPVQFREDKYIEKLLNGQIFSQEDRGNIETYIKLSLDIAQHGDEKVGCIIVDPVAATIIAIAHDRRHHHPIQHAVMVATDLVAASQGGGSWNMESEHLYHLPYSKDASDSKITELRKLNPGKDVKKMVLPYLCTGYDAYLSREPCIMCAMALVHSRIRRVFFAESVPWGALGSHGKLHLQEGLNHHYEVWKVLLKDASPPGCCPSIS